MAMKRIAVLACMLQAAQCAQVRTVRKPSNSSNIISSNSTVSVAPAKAAKASLQSLRSELKDVWIAPTQLDPNQHKWIVASDPAGPKPAWVDNPLAEYFFAYTTGPLLWKWHNYFHVYHKALARFQASGQPVTMLAVGVQSGGEVGMWRNYFGADKLTWIGVDINPSCKVLEQQYPGAKVLVGDQGDPATMVSQLTALGSFPADIIIDDGSHHNDHQIKTFETMYPYLKPNGIYIVEDTTTSYNVQAGSPHSAGSSAGFPAVYDPHETFVNHMKNRVDWVNGYWANADAAPADPFTTTVDSISFYEAVVVIEKRPHATPSQERRGSMEIPYCTPGQVGGCP